MTQDTITLNVAKRTTTGKQVRTLLTDGIVPAVIQDHGKPSLNVQADYMETYKVFRRAGKHHPVQLVSEGKKYTAMIKDVDFEPKKHTIRHVVFNAVSANEKVEAEVPLHAVYGEGNEVSPAERAGLLVLPHLSTVVVEAVSSKLPDALEYDAEKLVEVGDNITVADLTLPAGVELVTEDTQVIATVVEPAAVAAANEAAGGDAEPGDEQAVPSDTTPDSAEESTEGDEIRPGGKKEFEDKSQGHNPEKQ